MEVVSKLPELSLIQWILAIIGILTVSKGIITFLSAVHHYCFRRPLDIRKRYHSEGSWVVITGGSEGIGKSFGDRFARLGFNICLVARTEIKLEKARCELEYLNKNIKVKTVTADFSDYKNEEFFTELMDKIGDIEIAVLVNNVGRLPELPFEKWSQKQIQEMIHVNSTSQSLVSKYVVEKMLKRDHQRSAIINVSSFAAHHATPTSPLYCATKTMNDMVSVSMSEEYREKIDILSFRPYRTSTAMINHIPVGYDTISPDTAVDACLRDLGRERYTVGHWRHALRTWYFDMIPESMYMKKRSQSTLHAMKSDHAAKFTSEKKTKQPL